MRELHDVTVRLVTSKDEDTVKKLLRDHLNDKQKFQLMRVFSGIRGCGFAGCPEHILVLENREKEVIGTIIFNHVPEIYAVNVSTKEKNEEHKKLLVSAVAEFARRIGKTEISGSTVDEPCTKLCEHFEDNKACYHPDYIRVLNAIGSQISYISQGRQPTVTQEIYNEYYEKYIDAPPTDNSAEEQAITKLRAEIEKRFGKNTSYYNRPFITTDPQRTEMLNKINGLFDSNKNLFVILKAMRHYGALAQIHHEENSGSRWFGCGPLINETCGLKKGIDEIVKQFKNQVENNKSNSDLIK